MDPFVSGFVSTYRAHQDFCKVDGMISSQHAGGTKPRIPFRKYVGGNILRYIATTSWSRTNYNYTFDGTRIRLCVWVPAAHKTSIDRHHMRVLNFFVAVLNHFLGEKRGAVNVTLVNTPVRKQFPSADTEVFSAEHVNSGFTVKGIDHMGTHEPQKDFIYIYRSEEIHKVLLHELIHLYGFEFTSYNPAYDMLFIRALGVTVRHPAKNPSNPLALYEAYVETLATYGIVITKALFQQRCVDVGGRVASLMKDEAAFSLKQARRIWCRAARCGGHVEDTHVFSYYIVKSALLQQNMSAFRRYLKKFGVIVSNPVDFLKVCCDVVGEGMWLLGRGCQVTNTPFLRMTRVAM